MSHTGFFVCHQVVKIRQKTAGSSLNTFMYLNPYIIKNKSISVIDMVCPNLKSRFNNDMKSFFKDVFKSLGFGLMK
jgi:hypothetical protein